MLGDYNNKLSKKNCVNKMPIEMKFTCTLMYIKNNQQQI